MGVEGARGIQIIGYEPANELAADVCVDIVAARTYACYVCAAVEKI